MKNVYGRITGETPSVRTFGGLPLWRALFLPCCFFVILQALDTFFRRPLPIEASHGGKVDRSLRITLLSGFDNCPSLPLLLQSGQPERWLPLRW